ncbi:MAG: hypothetical protein J2P46_07675 [Zavarzinella sp.]|nr:hypothetical protein [Zavarzinella sp.]
MPVAPRQCPEMTVIGDSLAQGYRSFTARADVCAQGWPTGVAQAQGWEFATPDYPRPALFDLEAEVRRLDTLTVSVEQLRFEGFGDRFRRNLREGLRAGVESAARCFDNVALSGALVHDPFTGMAATSAADVAALTPDGAATQVPLARIGDLHIAIDGRFVLNPSFDPAFAGFTQLDWVRERRPELLVVEIGTGHPGPAAGDPSRGGAAPPLRARGAVVPDRPAAPGRRTASDSAGVYAVSGQGGRPDERSP